MSNPRNVHAESTKEEQTKVLGWGWICHTLPVSRDLHLREQNLSCVGPDWELKAPGLGFVFKVFEEVIAVFPLGVWIPLL